jgi:hypothetical protein
MYNTTCQPPDGPPELHLHAGTTDASTAWSRTMTPSRPRRRAVVASATLTLLALVGCQDDQARAAPAPPLAPAHAGRLATPGDKEAVHEASADLVSVSEADGRVLVELPIGSSAGVAIGAFFRVYEAADARRLKGMVQVTEIIDTQRSVARQIALSDRQDPFKPGDHAREVADLSKLADGSAIESSARAEEGHQAQIDSQDQQHFAALREQYQRELAKAEARHQAELQEMRAQLATQSSVAIAQRAHDLQLAKLEQRTDVASLKTTMTEQVAAGIAADHQASEKRIAELNAEKEALQLQVDSLLKQQGELSVRIAGLVKDLSAHDRAHGEEMRAEVETRELLSVRISELEARVAGKPVAPSVVLSAEPGRNETVLERLSRINKELIAEREHGKRLEASVTELQDALAAAKQAGKSLEVKVNVLTPDADRAATLAKDLDGTRTKLQDAERQRDALELQRLEAERTLYDLAARVLRLAGSSPETVALQARLRDVLSPAGPSDDKPIQDGAAVPARKSTP